MLTGIKNNQAGLQVTFPYYDTNIPEVVIQDGFTLHKITLFVGDDMLSFRSDYLFEVIFDRGYTVYKIRLLLEVTFYEMYHCILR